jgi:hypothetical protein
MKRGIIAVILGTLVACAAMPVYAKWDIYDIACPDEWPGERDHGVRLSSSERWFDGRTMFKPSDIVVSFARDKSILLDCAYGAAESGLRLTVQIPGFARTCGKPSPGHRSSWCTTQPEAGGTIGPIRIYIAERPDLETSLMGFRLRMAPNQIRAVAKDSGFACAEASETLRCTRESDRINIVFQDGRSVAIHWLQPHDQPGDGGRYDQVITRFGLHRATAADTPGRPDLWQQPNSPVRVTFAGDTDPMVLTLEDTAGPSPPAGRH